MLKVSIREEWRRFQIRVGEKLVGTVEGRKGYFCAYEPSKDGKREFIRSEETLRKAMQAVLVRGGFGKSGPGYSVKFVDVA